MTQPATKPKKSPIKGRISAPVAAAIRLIVHDGRTEAEAAKAVGLKQVSLCAALKRTHVAARVEGVKRAWLASRTDRAWLTMAQLAESATSEEVRLAAAKAIVEAAGRSSDTARST